MGGRTKALVGWLADRSVRRVVVGSFGIVAEFKRGRSNRDDEYELKCPDKLTYEIMAAQV